MNALEHRIPPPLLALALMAAMEGVALLAAPTQVPVFLRLGVASALLVAAGGFGYPSVIAFRRAGTTIDPIRITRASTLVTSGVYRITRNPMYLTLALLLCAWAAWLGVALAACGPVAFVAFITRFQILPEERQLGARFGADYDGYRKRVRRWL